jgi:hypothetical protein
VELRAKGIAVFAERSSKGSESYSQKLCSVNAGLAAHFRLEIVGGRTLWEYEMSPFEDGRNIRKPKKREKVGQQDLWCHRLNIVCLERFFSRKNIGFYRVLANKRTNATKRRKIFRLLAGEEIIFKLELKGPVAEKSKRA